MKYLDPTRTGRCAPRASTAAPSSSCGGAASSPAFPECIDQPIVGVAHDGVTVVLMRDVGGPGWCRWPTTRSPSTSTCVFLDHMAALHAHFWETDLDIDVVPAATRYLELSPRTAEREAALGSHRPGAPAGR